MKKVFYVKQGRRYVPVAEYDPEFLDRVPYGTHLTIARPGSTATRYNIDPAYAALIAAGIVAEDAVSQAIAAAAELRLEGHKERPPLTAEQQTAWQNLIAVMGERARWLEWPSAREAAQAATQALIEEAEKLLEYESVRQAYDHFLTVAALTKRADTSTK